MSLIQIINAVIIYAWLIVVAYLLYRHALGAGDRARQATVLLAEASMKSAEAAHIAAEAAKEATETARRLADILEKKHVP